MEIILLLLLLISLALLFYRSSKEKMTNKDLINTLNEFEKDGTSPSTKNKEPVYGPKTTKSKHPIEPEPLESNYDSNEISVYPDIYGPEIKSIPGKKVGSKSTYGSGKKIGSEKTYNEFGKEISDSVDFKMAFPHNENEPQPFLTDFSKFHK